VAQFNKIVATELKNDSTLKTMLRNHRIRSEQVMNLDCNMQPTSDPDKSVFTGIIDYIGRDDNYLTFIDWKSGKSKRATSDQIEYYALWGFKSFTNFDQIKIILWFVECGEKVETILHRSDMDIIETKLINKINEIENDDTFPKKKGKACDWCPYFDECIKKDMQWQSISQ
jgi:CRISPR/Cas system-associated exonuclease Cas4 (RecB family)